MQGAPENVAKKMKEVQMDVTWHTLWPSGAIENELYWSRNGKLKPCSVLDNSAVSLEKAPVSGVSRV